MMIFHSASRNAREEGKKRGRVGFGHLSTSTDVIFSLQPHYVMWYTSLALKVHNIQVSRETGTQKE